MYIDNGPMLETIYAIENKLDGRAYVGRTKYFLKSRWDAHRKLALVPTRDAGLTERLFTHLLESNDPQFGYNSPNIYRISDA
jgi:hypothetical protein